MGLVHRWDNALAYSRGVRQDTDIATIADRFPGCVSVEKTDLAMDKSGVDYIVTLRNGATVLIDAKTRRPGVSKFWREGVPELALEKWSSRPGGGSREKTGWTLSESSPVDCILFTFQPDDCELAFLYPFQHLRLAFRRYIAVWYARYKIDIQTSIDGDRRWQSEAVFVPEPVVWAAMRDVSMVRLVGSGFEGNPPTK